MFVCRLPCTSFSFLCALCSSNCCLLLTSRREFLKLSTLVGRDTGLFRENGVTGTEFRRSHFSLFWGLCSSWPSWLMSIRSRQLKVPVLQQPDFVPIPWAVAAGWAGVLKAGEYGAMPNCMSKLRLVTPAQWVSQAGPAAVLQPLATRFLFQCQLVKHGRTKMQLSVFQRRTRQMLAVTVVCAAKPCLHRRGDTAISWHQAQVDGALCTRISWGSCRELMGLGPQGWFTRFGCRGVLETWPMQPSSRWEVTLWAAETVTGWCTVSTVRQRRYREISPNAAGSLGGTQKGL